MATRRICNSVKILPLTTPVGSIQLVHHLPFLNNRRSFATTKSCVQTTESLPATSLIWPPPYISPTWAALTKRGSNDPELILPDLICLPTDMILNRGNLYQTAYNWLFTRLLLPNIYNSFSIKSFMADAAAAIEPISQHLARQEYEKLHGLLTHETLAQAKRSIDKMTDVQRERIALKRYDIFKMHIQKVQWVYTGGARPDSCYAEISMVFHVHEPYRHDPKKLNEYLERPKTQYHGCDAGVTICMYRFKKNYVRAEGIDSRWTVDMVNHIRVEDIDRKLAYDKMQKTKTHKFTGIVKV